MINKNNSSRNNLRHITPSGLLGLGVEKVAYIREVIIDGHKAYAVHGADGGPIHVAHAKEAAIASVSFSDMELVSLH